MTMRSRGRDEMGLGGDGRGAGEKLNSRPGTWLRPKAARCVVEGWVVAQCGAAAAEHGGGGGIGPCAGLHLRVHLLTGESSCSGSSGSEDGVRWIRGVCHEGILSVEAAGRWGVVGCMCVSVCVCVVCPCVLCRCGCAGGVSARRGWLAGGCACEMFGACVATFARAWACYPFSVWRPVAVAPFFASVSARSLRM